MPALPSWDLRITLSDGDVAGACPRGGAPPTRRTFYAAALPRRNSPTGSADQERAFRTAAVPRCIVSRRHGLSLIARRQEYDRYFS